MKLNTTITIFIMVGMTNILTGWGYESKSSLPLENYLTEGWTHEILDTRWLSRAEELSKNVLDVEFSITQKLLDVSVDGENILRVSSENSSVTPIEGVYIFLFSKEGRLMQTSTYYTNLPGQSNMFVQNLDNIQAGRFIILIGLSNWIAHLSREAEDSLQQLGFVMGGYPVNRFDTWAGVAVKGRGSLTEAIDTDNSMGPVKRIYFNFKLPKDKAFDHSCSWHSESRMKLQTIFCQRYGGYGDLCRCDDPFTDATRFNQFQIKIREEIPIVIITSRAPHRLLRQVKSLFNASGSAQTKYLVVIDGHHQETIDLVKLFGLNYIIHSPQGEKDSRQRPNTSIRFALQSVFNIFKDADKAVVLEDDLLVSPDIISYFQATSWLLDVDPTIFAINAFSYSSLPGIANDNTRLRRAQTYPYYGWMLKRNTAELAVKHWMNGIQADWDKWLLKSKGALQDRDVIVPEVSRTFHAGGGGVHVTGYSQVSFYDRIILNQDRNVELRDLSELVLSNYLTHIISEISRSLVVTPDVVEYEREGHSLLPANSSGPFVSFVKAGGILDENRSFATIMMGLGVYNRDNLETFRGLRILNIEGKYLHVVGCPWSLHFFCQYNPGGNALLSPSEQYFLLARRKMRRLFIEQTKENSRKRTTNRLKFQDFLR